MRDVAGMRRAAAIVAAWAVMVAGCSALSPAPADVARPCAEAFPVPRCEAILLATADNAGIDPATVRNVTILPGPSAETGVIGPKAPIHVRLTLADGQTEDTSFACPGVSGAFLPQCMEQPHLVLQTPIEGYRDTPEGATPVPEIEPAAEAAAIPLTAPRLDIPIAAPGPQRVKVGEVLLANGILREASFATEELWPSTVVLRGGTVRLELVSAVRGDVLRNIFEHGWVEGVERVDVFVVFDAGIVRPGARLVIVSLSVK